MADVRALPAKMPVMIVTGASSGIGQALALLASSKGYAVVAVARRAERLTELREAIGIAGGSCATVTADVTKPDAAKEIFDAAMRAFGRIDVVVNNAGAGAFGPLLEQSESATDGQWQLHVAGPLRLARLALAQLEKNRGQLVFVGSGLARVPLPSYGAYASAKAAVRAAAIQLRRELRSRGVAVTYVDPGLVATEFHEAMGSKLSDRVSAVSPERVAHAILRGIRRRTPVVNAVAWQTAGVVALELAAHLIDGVLSQMPATPLEANPKHRPAPLPAEETQPASQPQPQPQPGPQPPPAIVPPPARSEVALDSFDAALEPVARRMERVKLSPSFIRDALQSRDEVELNDLAMRWAGMPNKNERAALRDVLDALANAGYLQSTGDETWKVLRTAG
jgi:short-subunit dehydrogenase